jgi:DNA-binding transcriptional MerR regulator
MLKDYNNKLIKIGLAAKWLDVTQKTIYNWIENGLLEMPEKGKVRRGDVEEVHKNQIMRRSSISRLSALGIGRDEKGRFIDLPKDPN